MEFLAYGEMFHTTDTYDSRARIILKVIVILIVICFEKFDSRSYCFAYVITVTIGIQLSCVMFGHRWKFKACDKCFDYSVSLCLIQEITHSSLESAFISVRLFYF